MFQSMFQSMFQLHVSISITNINTKGIILFHNYKFVSRIGFTKGFTSVLRSIIISLVSWQPSIYTSLNFHQIEQLEAESKARTNTLQSLKYIIGLDYIQLLLFIKMILLYEFSSLYRQQLQLKLANNPIQTLFKAFKC